MVKKKSVPAHRKSSAKKPKKKLNPRQARAIKESARDLTVEAGLWREPPVPPAATEVEVLPAEEIAARLIYSGENPATRELIVETLRRVPPEIAQFGLTRCHFASVGRARRSLTLPPRTELEAATAPDWLIVLFEQLPAEQAPTIIATQIARAWLTQQAPSDELLEPEAAATEWLARFSGALKSGQLLT